MAVDKVELGGIRPSASWFPNDEGDDLDRFFSMKPYNAKRRVLAEGEAGKPSIVVMPSGEIVVSYIRGYNLAKNPPENERMEVIRSADGGETWSEAVRATNSPYNDREGYLILLPDGTLLLCYMRVMAHLDPAHPWQGPFICRSEDGGRTWSEAWQVDISAFCPAGPFGAGDRGHVVLPDGTLLLFVGAYEIPRRPMNYVMVSHDGGRTFPEYHLVSDMAGDSSFARLPSGKIIGFLRMNGADFPKRGAHPELLRKGEAVHFMGLSESEDNGKTWSSPRKATEYNEIPGHILALRGGRVLITYGVRHLPLGIQAQTSSDEGATWSDRLLLAWNGSVMRLSTGQRRHTIGHPYSAELPDGRIMTAYYRLADPFDAASCQVEALFWNI
jgi:hypothetical protein